MFIFDCFNQGLNPERKGRELLIHPLGHYAVLFVRKPNQMPGRAELNLRGPYAGSLKTDMIEFVRGQASSAPNSLTTNKIDS